MHTERDNFNQTGPAPESRAARAFSLAAPHYDRDQRRNRVARWSRQRSIELLSRYFRPGDRLLEVGCGTGEEALHFARAGTSVVATDAAPGMIATLQAKLATEPDLQAMITPYVLQARDLGRLMPAYGEARFDGAYSSFGPLNCEPDLEPVAAALDKLVMPGGQLVLSFINKYCAWETLWHLLKGRPRAAFRRWRKVAEATVRSEWQEERVPVYYRPLSDLERAFAPYFTRITCYSLPWLLPPQYLDPILRGRLRLFSILSYLDRAMSAHWPFNIIGDHVVIVFRRKSMSGWERISLPLWRRALRRIARQALLLRFRDFAPGRQRSKKVRAGGVRLQIERSVFDPSIHFTSAVMAAYLRWRFRSANPALRMLDLGTGSGVLAIAAARAGVGHITAVDVNPAAARSAQRNVQQLGVASKVRVLESDMFSAVEGDRFDVIVTNPPYYPGTPSNDADRAYFAGPNLDWLRRLAEVARGYLASGGRLLMVLGETAPIEAILAIFSRHNWTARLVYRKQMATEAIVIFEFKPIDDLPARTAM
jgi:methylase of polypeptide subunit release factors